MSLGRFFSQLLLIGFNASVKELADWHIGLIVFLLQPFVEVITDSIGEGGAVYVSLFRLRHCGTLPPYRHYSMSRYLLQY